MFLYKGYYFRSIKDMLAFASDPFKYLHLAFGYERKGYPKTLA